LIFADGTKTKSLPGLTGVKNATAERRSATSIAANGKGWEELAVEFEYDSNSFREHGHDPAQCDMIVCWAHNWRDCPVEITVTTLSEVIKGLSNTPILRPDRPF
jgi:hypothetical protein